ncbi:hypothetical protein FOCC_FOCC006470, partial [Frankliniella occidentalis]
MPPSTKRSREAQESGKTTRTPLKTFNRNSSRQRKAVSFTTAVVEQHENFVACTAAVHFDSDLSYCTNVQEELPEPEQQPTELHVSGVKQEFDGPFSIVEELSGDEGQVDDDLHSEESFILHYSGDSESDQEDQSEPLNDQPLNNQTIQLPSSPLPLPMPDDSSDEELLYFETSGVNLSIEEKIRITMLLAISKRHNLSYSAAEDVMELANILGKALVKSYFDKIVDPSKRQKIHECNLEDIYDGFIYTRMSNGGLTISFFVDGLQIVCCRHCLTFLQVASTSKRAAWPILCCVNELPLSIRRKSVMMASLWFSSKKPNCNEYMKPFVAECLLLEEKGITFKNKGNVINMEVKVLIGISDTVARPMLRNSIQFNGMFGCGFCLHPGIRLQYLRGHVRSYSTRDRDYPRRTHTQLMRCATIASNRQNGIPCKGIKGLSILSQLQNFNMVACLDLDLFHALVNVSKRFANLWFLKKFRGKQFNICSKFNEVNKRLLQITPTSNVSRAPRSMKDRSDFTGHEWFHWIIEYSLPVLKNPLPARFLNHWSLLVHGIALLMQNSIAMSEITYAGRYIKSFVTDVDILYGREHVTISMHLLPHSSQRKKLEEEVGEYLTVEQKNYLEKLKSIVHRLADPTLDIGPASLLGNPSEEVLSVEYLGAVRRADEVFIIESFLVLKNECFVMGNIVERSRTKLCDLNPPHIIVLKDEPHRMKKCFPVSSIQFKLLSFVLDSSCGTIRVACINVLENEML